MASTPSTTFIGLGIMGSRMASNLLKTGHPLMLHNRSTMPLVQLGSQDGAVSAMDPVAAVQNAQVVFTMLSNPQAVEEMAFGPQGFLQHMPKGSIWVDCSTVDPSFSRSCAARAQEAGLRFVEAPVAGSKPQAEAGELAFFVAGNGPDIDEVRPLLDAMGKAVIPMGSPGNASSYKLIVNLMLAQNMAAFAEAIKLGLAMGLDKGQILHMLPEAPVSAPFLKWKSSMLKDDAYPVQFPLELMHKDVALVTQMAEELNVSLPLAQAAQDLYAQAIEAGLAREDFAAVFKGMH